MPTVSTSSSKGSRNLRNGLRKDQDRAVPDRYRMIFSPGPDDGPS
ncbi:17613_t:CDS:2 [Cetraspora pellucida]|uniref:17613_t:CDS:1 n=1 Tax=Cetraspora pellucida TaxID=1433469 RepID=A0A9N9FV89_9GLOM|nr:17613_t:CDS:2 [Cetraspora pellucida]